MTIMKKHLLLLTSALACFGLIPAHAQIGSRGGGPNFGGAVGKLFGENQAYAARLELQTSDGNGNTITMPGNLCFDSGKSRFEINMSEIQGTKMPAGSAAQMKSMGLDQTISISRPDKKTVYIIYPGMQSYVANPLSEREATDDKDFKIETTELGKETVDGHPCVKNKVVVTDKKGEAHESTVWNATDLNKFPVKIETSEQGHAAIMRFKNITFTKPDPSQFEVPAGFTKYDNMQTMMQQQMMKRMAGGGMGMPPGNQ